MRTKPSRRERRAFNSAYKYKERLQKILSVNALTEPKPHTSKRKQNNV
jgi:hypothetical protein